MKVAKYPACNPSDASGACAYVLWPLAQNDMTSEDVVQQIVARADGKNAEVDLSFLGDKVCFAAESAPGGHYAKIFFPDSDLSAIPGYEPSEGIWFLYIDRAKKARMFQIPQKTLAWDTNEYDPRESHLGCGLKARIVFSGGTPSIIPLFDRKP
ncbi:MAG: hypothetical protein AB7S74_18225 [Hyphomicrobium sp.]